MANDISDAIQTAVATHQAGDLQTAERMYRGILAVTPEDAGIVNLLGIALLQQNRLPEADAQMRRAIELYPFDASFHFNLANIATALGNSAQAETSYRSALKLQPHYPEATHGLCNLLEAREQYQAAAQLCQEAIRLAPQDVQALIALARLCEKQGDIDNALTFCQRALSLQPGNRNAQLLYIDILRNQAGLLLAARQYEATSSVYRRVLEISPTDSVALHMLAAIENRDRQAAALDRIRELFDSHADEYEQQWQGGMGYDIPSRMRALLAQRDPHRRYEILDLGCGTGLSGLALHDLASRMVGVDVSPRMLEQARAKEIYAELHPAEILDYLEQVPDDSFDLVVSADVFAYVGDLSEVFAEAGRVLRADGLLVFSTEEPAASSAPAQQPATTGRKFHRAEDLHALIREHGYRPLHLSQEILRTVSGNPVTGHVVVLQKSAEMPSAYSGDEIEQAVDEILSDHYADATSVQGWLFSTLIDHRFFDSQLVRQPVQRHPAHWQTSPEAADLIRAADEHLARIERIDDVAAQWAALEELTQLDTPSLTQDSFAGLTETQSRQELRQFFSGDRLNVVIIGAGPAGLALASALKLSLHAGVDVLLVENRVSSLHHKLPYERRWITNIPSSFLHGLVEQSLSDIFARIGNGTHMGCTVNVLESLLLLSCRRLGVKFLFSEDCDYSFVQDSPVHLIFDASGNRFQPPAWPRSADEITVRHNIRTDWLGISDNQLRPYGIKIHPSADNRHITLGTYNNLFFPLYKNNQRIKLAVLKLVHIPSQLYGPLENFISHHNPDNKYYVWPGTLQPAINQLIVIINLEKTEYDHLCLHHVFPMAPAEALQNGALCAALDERTVAILRLIAEHTNERDGVSIEAPFLFEPYLMDCTVPGQLYGRPLLRVGDSVYNGNVKWGNGLGEHLRNVRHIQTVLKKLAR